MTDREFLELAAKAAGIPGVWVEKSPADGYPTYSCGIGRAGLVVPLWNPLEDDGDSLRLAVKLNLSVSIECESAGAVCVQWGFDQSGEASGAVVQESPIGGDDYAATRRAIVRAAAEIGKKKE